MLLRQLAARWRRIALHLIWLAKQFTHYHYNSFFITNNRSIKTANRLPENASSLWLFADSHALFEKNGDKIFLYAFSHDHVFDYKACLCTISASIIITAGKCSKQCEGSNSDAMQAGMDQHPVGKTQLNLQIHLKTIAKKHTKWAMDKWLIFDQSIKYFNPQVKQIV